MNKNTLESFLREKIPLSEALGVKVVEVSDIQVELEAPLAPNHNHLGSAFGGSISALLILGGYTWLYHYMTEKGNEVHVILKSCQIEYLHPIEEDLRIITKAPEKKELVQFEERFGRKGLGRIFLNSQIMTGKGVAAKLRGEFVVKTETIS